MVSIHSYLFNPQISTMQNKFYNKESSVNKGKQILENGKAVEEKEDKSTDSAFEKLYRRLQALAIKLGISISKTESIPSILARIKAQIAKLEKENNNPTLNAIKSEYDSINQEYLSLISGESGIMSGLEILSINNRASLGI